MKNIEHRHSVVNIELVERREQENDAGALETIGRARTLLAHYTGDLPPALAAALYETCNAILTRGVMAARGLAVPAASCGVCGQPIAPLGGDFISIDEAAAGLRVERYIASGEIVPLAEAGRTVEEATSRLRRTLWSLKRGSCWCEVGIDNPMMQGRHSRACLDAQTILGEVEAPPPPAPHVCVACGHTDRVDVTPGP